jgi:putative ABC transport system substrate-binding protein
MRRREFITALGGAAAAWPLAARAQRPPMPVIGFLSAERAELSAGRLDAFRQGLSETGYVEGRNVTIEYRWADDQYDRFPALAADLVRRQVTVIVAIGNNAALAAKSATSEFPIPIAFFTGSDPLQVGLVASLNRPGGNLTGVTTLGVEIGPKRLELLHEAIPSVRIIVLLVNPTNPVAESQTSDHQAAADSLGLQLRVLHASSDRGFETVFAALPQLRAGGLVIGPDGFLLSRREQLAALASRYGVPAIFQYREFAVAGGLMSYGTSIADADRQVGVYAGRLLKGEKPASLPVQQATKVELIVNLRAARALGLTIPLPLLGRADEVIE